MIYPRVPLATWLKKYPALVDEDDVSFCKCETPDLQPWLSQKYIGLECQTCRTSTWIFKKKEDNERWVEMLLGD
jgi:hypothetical protein